MSLAEHVLRTWAEHPTRGLPFVAHRERPARPAQTAPIPDWIPDPIRSGLAAQGIGQLYTHQTEGLAAVHAGENVVVATPTASGKTLVFALPALTACYEDPGARALFLYPTKALAHDQVIALDTLANRCGVEVAAHAYDGDTPSDARRSIRAAARVVVSNPDMLHAGIMPHHDRWHRFFAGLRYVVLDEAHVYRGVFGSHVANVIRRLRRICRFHGAKPQFILSTATIANPGQHAEALIEAPVREITKSGAPVGRQSFFVYNPPLIDGSKGIRQSYVQAARRITRALAKADVPTIVFANTRLGVERLTRHLQEDVASDSGDPETVAGYRGGYLPQHRRGIEQGLREGRIKTVVSTSALELGVDIGQLEACVLAGYPGSIASTLQRAGRAGRRDSPAVVVLVARAEPVDQYLAGHPEFFFGRSPEHARLQADNLLIVADHIKCAAFELPFQLDESLGGFGVQATDEVLSWLASRRIIHRGTNRWQWTGDPYPSHRVPLRSIAEGNFTILDQAHGHAILGEVDYFSAAKILHPQAIHIIGGRTFQVQTLDWTGRRALVEPVHVDYYTDSMQLDGVRALQVFDERPLSNGMLVHGEVHVFERVVGFKKIRFATGENVGFGDVALPENELHTTAIWIRPDASLPARVGLPRHRVIDGLQGIADALRRVASVHVMCDPRDLETALVTDEAPKPDQLPSLYLYENYPGGVGAHEQLFVSIEAVLDGVASLLGACACEDGCPGCVGAPAPIAHAHDRPRSRRVAAQVLAALRLRTLEQTGSVPTPLKSCIPSSGLITGTL